jgi:hypothetical protein
MVSHLTDFISLPTANTTGRIRMDYFYGYKIFYDIPLPLTLPLSILYSM